MNETVAESRAAACTWTGELTDAPFAGEQMVTEGDVDPGLQVPGWGVGVGVGGGVGVGVGLGELPLTFTEIVCLKMFPALSFAWIVSRCVPAEAEMEVLRDPPLVVNTAFPSR